MNDSINHQLDFNDLEHAFRDQTFYRLLFAWFLFCLMQSRILVSFGSRLVSFLFALRLPVKQLIKWSVFKQFCGGEDIDGCKNTIELLRRSGVGSILDYSVECEYDISKFDKTMDEIKSSILAVSGQDHAFAVFKASAIADVGLMEEASKGRSLSSECLAELEAVEKRVEQLCQYASELKVSIMVDAEESWIQDSIDDITLRMMEAFNKERPVVYLTLQMYRVGRLDYMKSIIDQGSKKSFFPGFKLVRGAYMEYERARALELNTISPIHLTKEAVDSDFNAALEYCINATRIDRVGLFIGTHNEESTMLAVVLLTKALAARNNKSTWVVFGQLFGMSDHLTFNLAKSHFYTYKYLPYGPVKETLPYLVRRAEENTSISGQVGRELQLRKMELVRRLRNRFVVR